MRLLARLASPTMEPEVKTLFLMLADFVSLRQFFSCLVVSLRILLEPYTDSGSLRRTLLAFFDDNDSDNDNCSYNRGDS